MKKVTKFSIKKVIYLVTFTSSIILVIYGLLLEHTVALWVGFSLGVLSFLFEIVLLRCPFCKEKIRGKGFWAGWRYIITQMRVKECQNPSCGKPLI